MCKVYIQHIYIEDASRSSRRRLLLGSRTTCGGRECDRGRERERDSPPSPPASGRESDGLARPAARRVTEPRENEREETRAGEPVDSRRRGATHARMHARTHILSTHRRSVLELEYLLLEEKKTVVVSRNSGLLSWDFLFVFGIDWF